MQDKFGKHIHGKPISNAENLLTYSYIVYVENKPIGYIQAYNARSFAQENDIEVNLFPMFTAGLDFFIGESEYLNKDLGSVILESFWQQILKEHFEACVVDPSSTNTKAIKTFIKAGFKEIIRQLNKGKIWMIKKGTKSTALDPIVSFNNAPHFLWGKNCDGWWLKQDGRFTVILESMPKGASEVTHFHQETEQFFYVLEGILKIELNGIRYDLQQNESIVVMPGIIHKVFNDTKQNVRFLVISCPASHEDRVNVEA